MAGTANAAAKWLAAMQSPQTTQAYKDGIASVTQSPMAAAAAPDAEQRYVQNTQASVSSGRRAAALNAVSLQQWQALASGKGGQRISGGATAAAPKVQAHFQKFGPVYQQIKQTVAGMPKGGMVNALARVQASMTMLQQAAGKSTA